MSALRSYLTPRRSVFLTYAGIGLLALASALRLLATGDPPWAGVAVVAVLTALISGPGVWLARDRLPEDQRETLSAVGIILAPIAFVLLLGILLAFDLPAPPVRITFDALVVGGFLGALAALLAELTVVPKRLRNEAL